MEVSDNTQVKFEKKKRKLQGKINAIEKTE